MTRDQVFDAWAPRHTLANAWSDWAKPVLFAQIPASWSREPEPLPTPTPEILLPEIPPATLVILDLPGDSAVWAGLALAERGFRPVPLYNGVADDSGLSLAMVATESTSLGAVINAWPIILALWKAAPRLQSLSIPDHAPPVFLLDSRRREGERAPAPGLLDNRWVSFPTDFPSANLLLERRISKALVITSTPGPPAADLSHTLLRWQEAGLKILSAAPAPYSPLTPIDIRRPSFFRAAWYQLLTTFGMRRSLLGGFGGRMPQPSGG